MAANCLLWQVTLLPRTREHTDRSFSPQLNKTHKINYLSSANKWSHSHNILSDQGLCRYNSHHCQSFLMFSPTGHWCQQSGHRHRWLRIACKGNNWYFDTSTAWIWVLTRSLQQEESEMNQSSRIASLTESQLLRCVSQVFAWNGRVQCCYLLQTWAYVGLCKDRCWRQ